MWHKNHHQTSKVSKQNETYKSIKIPSITTSDLNVRLTGNLRRLEIRPVSQFLAVVQNPKCCSLGEGV